MHRPLPSCPEAERELLGWVIGSQRDSSDVLAMVRADDFHDVKHAKIYEAIAELGKQRQTIDLVMVAEKMRSMGLAQYLGAVGGDAYLAGLVAECSYLGADNASAHAKLVLDASRRRAVILASAQLVEKAYSGELTSAQLVEQFQSQLGALADRSHAKVPRPFREYLHAAIRQIEARWSDPNKSAVNGIPTGLTAADELTMGWQVSEATVIAARPSMGKSSLGMQTAIYAAEQGHPVLVFALEMSGEETTIRSLASESRVNSKWLKTGMLQTANFIAISKTTGRLAGLPIMLDDDGSQSAATICAKARRWRRDPSIFKTGDERGMILIDYLQMIKRQPGSKAQNKEQEVTETFRELKAMAKELKVALVCLASLSRECEKRNDKRPIPSDLRDSGNIESDADSIMMIYRDEAYNDKTDEPGVAELIIRKARNGSVGMVKTRWHAEHTSFADL